MKRNYIWIFLVVAAFAQCTKTKLSPLPDYKATAGIKLDSSYLHLAVIAYDTAYTYILDDRYGYHAFYRISETDGKTEVLKRFAELESFMVTENYLYAARPNVYPQAFSTLCRYNKRNLDDSIIINTRMIYNHLIYKDGYFYGLDKLFDLCKVDPATGNGVEILKTTDKYISQVSFTSYINSSQFYNGWWLFLNEDAKYLLKVKMDGSKQTDTIQSVKTPIFAIHNDRIYFALKNSNASNYRDMSNYQSCLASVSVNGGPATIEDTTNLRICNTVSNYGNLLLIGDGRFIKTFDLLTKEVKIIGAIDAVVDEYGKTIPAYPFVNGITGSTYYSTYNDKYPVYKIR